MPTESFDNIDNNFSSVQRMEAETVAQLKTSSCKALLKWWQSFAPNIPHRVDFDIIDHFKYASNIFLVEVIGHGEYIYRVQGDAVGDLVGTWSMGETFSKDFGGSDLENYALYVNDLIAGQKPICCFGTLEMVGRPYVKFESLDLPLLNDAGQVGFVLGVITRIDDP